MCVMYVIVSIVTVSDIIIIRFVIASDVAIITFVFMRVSVMIVFGSLLLFVAYAYAYSG